MFFVEKDKNEDDSGKLRFNALARERPSLPLWGRWQPEGLTEEGIPQYECAEMRQDS